jgi:hypothetical protein
MTVLFWTINIDLKALELVIEEKHVMGIMQPDAGMLRQRVCLSEGNIPYTINNMDSDEIIKKTMACTKIHATLKMN